MIICVGNPDLGYYGGCVKNMVNGNTGTRWVGPWEIKTELCPNYEVSAMRLMDLGAIN